MPFGWALTGGTKTPLSIAPDIYTCFYVHRYYINCINNLANTWCDIYRGMLQQDVQLDKISVASAGE